jgi:hypothetical protein
MSGKLSGKNTGLIAYCASYDHLDIAIAQRATIKAQSFSKKVSIITLVPLCHSCKADSLCIYRDLITNEKDTTLCSILLSIFGKIPEPSIFF